MRATTSADRPDRSKGTPSGLLVGFVLLACLMLLGGLSPVSSKSGLRAGDTVSLRTRQETAAELRELSLTRAVRMGLKNNLDLKVVSLEPELSAKRARAELREFNPELYSDNRINAVKQPTASSLTASNRRTEEYQAGVRARTTHGIVYDLTGRLQNVDSDNVFRTVNPTNHAFAGLEITLPLLRNSGQGAVLAPFRRLKFEAKSNRYQYRSKVNEKISEIQLGYWEFVKARNLLRIAREGVELANQIVSINRAKLEENKIPPVELTQAQVGQSKAREVVVRYEGLVGDRRDQLLQAIAPDTETSRLRGGFLPISEPRTWIDYMSSDLPDSGLVDRALKIHPEMKGLTMRIKAQRQRIHQYANESLPEFNLTGSYGVRGLDEDRNESLNELEEGDFDDWSFGFNFSYKLGGSAADDGYRQALTELKQVRLSIKNLESEIERTVREARRGVRTARSRVEFARSSTRLAKKQLSAQTQRFKLGLINTSELIDVQQDYLTAKEHRLEARIELALALTQLREQTGLLLKEYVHPSI